MPFSLDIPDPATMRVGKEAYHLLPAGTELHRIHLERFGSDEFNGTDLGDARFSPIRDTGGTIIPTIYAAQTFACATCEIVLRCPDVPTIDPKTGLAPLQIVYPSDYQAHAHSQLRTATELKLVELTMKGQRKIGVDKNALLAGPKSSYPETRAWAERIHAQCPEAEGLYYNSAQFGPDFAIVLFGGRVPAGAFSVLGRRRVADAPCHAEIGAIADMLSIDYEDV
jgi:hypothetical protein